MPCAVMPLDSPRRRLEGFDIQRASQALPSPRGGHREPIRGGYL